jgi:hypothetical protein
VPLVLTLAPCFCFLLYIVLCDIIIGGSSRGRAAPALAAPAVDDDSSMDVDATASTAATAAAVADTGDADAAAAASVNEASDEVEGAFAVDTPASQLVHNKKLLPAHTVADLKVSFDVRTVYPAVSDVCYCSICISKHLTSVVYCVMNCFAVNFSQ